MVTTEPYLCFRVNGYLVFAVCQVSLCDASTRPLRACTAFLQSSNYATVVDWYLLELRSTKVILRHPNPSSIVLNVSDKLNIIGDADAQSHRRERMLCRNLHSV